MANKGKYYMTTAIAYTSGKPHIGNTYEIILADAIARYKRAEGYDVYFQTGTDEHGQKIQEKAEAAGISPKEFVDQISGEVKRIWDMVNSSYDNFVRTTDEDHEKCVKKIFKKLYDQGDIYKGSYEGLYCTPCESFWTESQLVDGKCPDCGREVQPAKEEAYFFKMSKYADRLIDYINTHPDFIQPVSRKNEMMNNFLLPGLQDLCVSRTSFSWGIPVDFDPKHVVYVWLDALTNYITKIGYDPDGSSELFKKNWPADLHLIGKDIVRFHTIYWPIFLMALDLPLPKQVFGHPWLLQGGDKMSKSKGNVIYADDMVRLFGVDATRYFVLHEMPFENDGIITWDLVIERFNSDLANILGNLVNRTVSMSNKYFDGIVKSTGATGDADQTAIGAVMVSIDKQSADIAMGVDKALEAKEGDLTDNLDTGAGDQGMMFGYATNETEEYMPYPIALAHKLAFQLTKVRKDGTLTYLRPDGKTQVSVEYDEAGKPVRLEAVVLSTQHDEDVTQEQIHEDIKKYVFDPILPKDMIDDETKFFINPTGRFVIGGPHGDAGLTGRKIIVDTYGGYARHGGGAFSGKDCTKVDRSAAYAARYVAKNLVAAGFADRCEIQLSYAIGVAQPTSIMVDTFGTGKLADDRIVEIVRENFDLRPAGIIKMLDLRRPIYRQTAAYGHFGRTDIKLPWEALDKVEDLKKYL